MSEKLYIPISILVAGLLMAGALYLADKGAIEKSTTSTGTSAANPVLQAGEIPAVTAHDHIVGNPGADVTIVEYSDTECPYCKDYFSTLEKITQAYGTQVAWVYRYFPIHTRASKEAQAAECASELGGGAAFWKYISTLYSETQSNDTFDPNQLPVVAGQIGLNEENFSTCLDSGKYASLVQSEYNDAVAAGGQGTPFTVLITKDGTHIPIQGEESYATLKQTIDLLLASSTSGI